MVVVAWVVPVVTFNDVMNKLIEHGYFSGAGAASMKAMLDGRILALLVLLGEASLARISASE